MAFAIVLYLLAVAMASHGKDFCWPYRSRRYGSKISSKIKCHSTVFSFSHDPVHVLPQIVVTNRLLQLIFPIGKSMSVGGLVGISF